MSFVWVLWDILVVGILWHILTICPAWWMYCIGIYAALLLIVIPS